jgi:hypothetical protein
LYLISCAYGVLIYQGAVAHRVLIRRAEKGNGKNAKKINQPLHSTHTSITHNTTQATQTVLLAHNKVVKSHKMYLNIGADWQ